MEFYDKIFTIMYGPKLLIKKHAVTQVNYTITQEIYLLRINQLKTNVQNEICIQFEKNIQFNH